MSDADGEMFMKFTNFDLLARTWDQIIDHLLPHAINKAAIKTKILMPICLAKALSGITDKTLSKELKLPEANQLVDRKAHDSFPPTVSYTITAHGLSLQKVLDELHLWGAAYREHVIGKRESA
jgi:hypothetical protein